MLKYGKIVAESLSARIVARRRTTIVTAIADNGGRRTGRRS